MSLSGFFPLLTETSEFQYIENQLNQESNFQSVIIPDPSIAFVLAALWFEWRRPVFIMTQTPDHARKMVDQLILWCGESAPVYQFLETDHIPFERYIGDLGGTHQRLRTISKLSQIGNPICPPIVVASVSAVVHRTLKKTSFEKASSCIRANDRIERKDLISNLIQAGYTVTPVVEIPGDISIRGGIVDVFPVSSKDPIRIDFFDDEIESIREFDLVSQRSATKLDEIFVPPARETLPKYSDIDRVNDLKNELDFERTDIGVAQRINTELNDAINGKISNDLSFYGGFFDQGSIFEYLPQNSLVVTIRPNSIEDICNNADARVSERRKTMESMGEIPRNLPQPLMSWDQLSNQINRHPLRLSILPWGLDLNFSEGILKLPIEPIVFTKLGIERFTEKLRENRSRSLRTLVMSNHTTRLSEVAKKNGLHVSVKEVCDNLVNPGEIILFQGALNQGFTLSMENDKRMSVITDAEIFGVAKERYRPRKRAIRKGPQLEQLRPNSYVVHIDHGIARFKGTEVLNKEGKEFLVLEYAEHDKLFVPTEHLDRIQFYHGPTSVSPKLTRLGTQEWKKARSRAKRATERLAADLIAIYAAREIAEGYASSKDSPWQDSLEASFPYEETPDQIETLQEVKTDLESARPMDRLICGDVGYGKTEIALRAAFKVVQSGRQVGILVPTTVLAQQHYDTFNDRLVPFPVTIDLLSRFRGRHEQRGVIKRLSTGEIDILIGTHRMLQKDVRFKNIGLVIIDEEHKFGVSHKEKLKQFRSEIDVMTLSATPIPRTLQMSLAGVRDMSTINTAPEERVPVKTYVTENSDSLIKEAVIREIERNGQAFFLHNRVKDIDAVGAKLEQLIPRASFKIAHGQMPSEQLEEVMASFERRDFDVLICTTIIESGIDLPNVNTIIIDDADKFGLSQLYQLRGRIGRSVKRGYAYLLVPPGKALTATADARLNTILAANELGSGFQVALKDLEIRGMGNILGGEQSGHVAAVGFDLYNKLLSDAVSLLRLNSDADGGQIFRDEVFARVVVDLGIDAHIPDSYIEDLAQRLTIYQRIAKIHTLEALEDLKEELCDRFGQSPLNVSLLFQVEQMRILSESIGIERITSSGVRVTLNLIQPTGDARAYLQRILGNNVHVGHSQIHVNIDRNDSNWIKGTILVLKNFLELKERLMNMTSTIRNHK